MQELLNLRTANSKTLDVNGRIKRCEIVQFPLHYKNNYEDKNEGWKDIDLTVKNGELTTAPYDLTIGERDIVLRDKRTGTISTITPLTAGGKTATAKDFVIEPFHSGIRVKRTINSKLDNTNAEFAVDIKGEGIQLISSARDKDGADVPVVSEIKDGKLTERIDTSVLSALSTAKFPLTIDPTEVIIQPSGADTFLYLSDPTGNFGTNVSLTVSTTNVGTTKRRILARFVHGVPVGQNIISSSLGLYYFYWYTGMSNPSGKTVFAYKLSRTDWVENQATWNRYKTNTDWTTAGGDYVTSDPAGGSTMFPAGYGWMAWDVLAITQDAYTNGNAVELLLKLNLENEHCLASFHSNNYVTDTTLCPKLTIDYEAAGGGLSIPVAMATYMKMRRI
jgi:hypothetical protein